MIEIKIILLIMFIHWFADFICQSDEIAKNKSKSFSALTKHTAIYSTIFGLAACFFMDYTNSIIPTIFAGITFVTHTLIDFITSKINSKLYSDGKTHWFFTSIGFDQFLHLSILMGTYLLLNNR